MKKIYCFIFSALLLVTGCYKEEFIQIEDEMKNLQEAEIAPLNAQVSKISGSLTTLNALGEELKTYISALEVASGDLQGNIEVVNAAIQEMKSVLSDNTSEAKGEVLAKLENTKSFLDAELATIEATVAALKAKYVSLEEQIAALEETAEEKYATLDWVNGTFATIDQQNAVIAEVEAVKALASGLNSTTVKLDKELKDYLDAIAKQCLALADSKLIEESQKITDAYKEVIENAVSEVKEAYTAAIAEAISVSEKSVMDWVSEALTDYYELTSAQAQIEAFKAIIGNVPSGKSLQGEIDELTKEIGELGTELGDAYKDAITSAIEKSEGNLGDYLRDNIIDIRTKELNSLTDKVASLEGEIENLWKKLGEMEARINSLESQKNAIQESLQILTDTENTLEQYIAGIVSELEGKDIASAEILKGLLAELKNAATKDDNSLSAQIEALKSYIGTIPTSETSITAWVEGSKNTLDKFLELCAKLDYVNGLNEEISGLLENHSGRLEKISERLGKEIEDSIDIITGWVNKKLQKDYYDGEAAKCEIDVLESTLRSAFQTADATLETNIANLRQEIKDSDAALRSALATAIETAISKFNGYVSRAVTDELNRITSSLTPVGEKFTELEGIIAGMTQDVITLNEQITTLKGSITVLQTFIKNSGYDSMKGIVEAFDKIIEALPTTYASYSKYQEIYKLIYDKDGYKDQIEKLETLRTDLNTAEEAITGYQELVAGFTLSGENKQNLKKIFDEINEDLTTLKTTVFGTGPTDPKGLRNQLNEIVKKKDEILTKITELNGKLLDQFKSITTIAAIPNFNDGKLHIDYNEVNDDYRGTIQFDVRPKGIAHAVAENAKIKYVYTPVRSSINFTEANATIKGNNNEGRITADVILPVDDVTDGLSLALFAEHNGYEVVSDFIAVYTEKRSNILYTSPSSYFVFDGVGGTKFVDVYYSTEASDFTITNNCKNGREFWLEENLEVARHTITDKKGNKLYHRQYSLTASPNNTSGERTGTIDIEIKYGGFIGIGRSTETISVSITQHKRDNQKFEQFNPESGTIQFTWDGYVLGANDEKTENKYKDITVTTSDLLDDWSVTATEQNPWYSVAHRTSDNANQARISSLGKNETGLDRTGTIKFQSATGTSDDVSYTFTQLKREPTEIESITIDGNPVEEVYFSFDGKKYKTSEDGEWQTLPREGGKSLYMTVTTKDGSTDWRVSEDPNSDWITSGKYGGNDSKYLSLSNIAAIGNDAVEDRSLEVVISNSAGVIGILPVTQIHRDPTTITPKDLNLLFSYDGTKYSLDDGDNWTNISRNNPCSITAETGDGSTDWTVSAVSDGDWLTATTNDNSSTVTISAAAWYETTEDRTGTITFKLPKQEGESTFWTVRQEKAPGQIFTFAKVTAASYNYVIGEDGLIHIGQTGGNNMYVYVKGSPSDDWTMAVNEEDSWLTRDPGTRNTGRSDASSSRDYDYRIQISAGANNDVEERKTTIKFTCNGKDYIYDVLQDGREAQSFEEFNPASGTIQFSWNGYLLENDGNYTNNTSKDITVKTSDNKTDWTVAPSEDENWYSVAHRTSSNANQARISNVADNTSDLPRTGTIKFTSATGTTTGDYTFTQLERKPTELLTTDPQITFSFDGTQYKSGDGKWNDLQGYNSSKYLDITINTKDKSGDWNIGKSDNSDDWFTVSARPENDSQNHTSIRIYPQANAGDARESKIKFTFGLGDPVEWTIMQEAHQDMTITVDPEYLEIVNNYSNNNSSTRKYRTSATGSFDKSPEGNYGSYYITAKVTAVNGDSGDWTCALKESKQWINKIEKQQNGNIRIYPQNNNNLGLRDEATIVFKYANGDKQGQEITTWSFYKQGRDSYKFARFDGKTEFDYKAQNSSITVTTDPSGTANRDWNVKVLDMEDKEVGDNFWLKASNAGNNKASLTLTKNDSGSQRQAKLLFYTFEGEDAESAKKITITQTARPTPQTITSITPDKVGPYTYNEQTIKLTVVTSDGETDWDVSPTSGSDYYVTHNDGDNFAMLHLSEAATEVNGTVTFTPWGEGREPKIFSFTQKAKPSSVNLTFSPASSISFEDGSSNRTQTITVTPDPADFAEWSVNTGTIDDWLEVTRNGNVLTLKALSNNPSSENERTATLTFTAPGFSQDYTVTQPPFSLTLEVNPSTIYFSGDGKKYKTSENSNWEDTKEQKNNSRHQYYYVPVEVSLSDKTNNWDIAQSSSWSGEKNGSTLRVKPSENLTWSAEKPSGKITVQSTADESITKDITIVQNRPLTVTSSTGKLEQTNGNTFTITVKSDSDWRITGLKSNYLSATISNNQDQEPTSSGKDITITINTKNLVGSWSLLTGNSSTSTNFTISNDEGDSHTVTVTSSKGTRATYPYSISVN